MKDLLRSARSFLRAGPNTGRFGGMMMVLFILLCSISPAAAGERVLDSEAQLEEARSLMAGGHYREAIAELDRFIYFFPEDPRVPLARHLMGVCYLEEGRYGDARAAFGETLREAPDGPLAGKALLLIGESYYREGRYDRAGTLFGELSQGIPSPQVRNAARYRLGWTRMQQDRWREAADAFSRVDPTDPLYPSAADLAAQSLNGERLPAKDPVSAGVMAGVLPGLGHAYASRYKDALVAFLLNGLFIGATVLSFDRDHNVLGGILAFFEAGWYTGNIYSAVHATQDFNKKVREDFRKGLPDGFDIHILTSAEGPAGVSLTFRF